jgi:hypothetical protein
MSAARGAASLVESWGIEQKEFKKSDKIFQNFEPTRKVRA